MPPHKNTFHSHKDLHEEQSSKIEHEQKLDHQFIIEYILRNVSWAKKQSSAEAPDKGILSISDLSYANTVEYPLRDWPFQNVTVFLDSLIENPTR